MRRDLVVANWKMHGGRRMVDAYATDYAKHAAGDGVDVVVCPPLAYLAQCVAAFSGTGVRFGAQNVAAQSSGPYTGEHAAEMARDLGATFAIVGHSERRALFGEGDAAVAQKCQAARRAGLEPILCVGETLAERRAGQASATVLTQLEAALAAGDFSGVVAYEPVWAIGTGETATAAEAQEMHAVIRARLPCEPGVRVLYGGSVNADNAAALFAEPDVDGALVGGASLDARAFAAICSAAASATPWRLPRRDGKAL